MHPSTLATTIITFVDRNKLTLVLLTRRPDGIRAYGDPSALFGCLFPVGINRCKSESLNASKRFRLDIIVMTDYSRLHTENVNRTENVFIIRVKERCTNSIPWLPALDPFVKPVL